MAYDETLAARVRDEIGPEPGITEKKMFGGLAFLVHGNMAVGVSGQGGLMVRCEHEATDDHIASGAQPFEMRGSVMRGWLRVDTGTVEADDELAEWVRVGLEYARSLPPK